MMDTNKINDRKIACSDKIEWAANRMSFISALLKASRSDNDFDKRVRDMLAIVCSFIDADKIRLYTLANSNEVIYVYVRSDDYFYITSPEVEPPVSDFKFTSAILAERSCVYVDKIKSTEGCREEFGAIGGVACYVYAIKDDDDILGILALSVDDPEHIWDDDFQELSCDISELFASFLKHKMDISSISYQTETLRMVLDNIDSQVCITDLLSSEIIYANRKFVDTFGGGTRGRKLSDVMGNLQRRANVINIPDTAINDSNTNSYECYCQKTEQWFVITERVTIWNGGKMVNLITINDITDIVEYEKIIEHEAFFDNLTGLPNRRSLEIKLNSLGEVIDKANESGYVMLLDLDNFKNINDSLGYRYGDELLKMIADMLKKFDKLGVYAYRFGGDEFALVIPTSDEKVVASILDELFRRFSMEWTIFDDKYFCTVSIGYVKYPKNGTDCNSLMTKADMALYSAKKYGKNRAVCFEKDIEVNALRTYEIERCLRRDVVGNCKAFKVFYQPIINTKTKHLLGAEALLRWDCDSLGAIGPSEFIPIAENLGLINSLGDFVIREAIKQYKKWKGKCSEDFKININLSVCQLLENEFIERLKMLFAEEDMEFDGIIFEVTESLAINDMEKMKNVLNAIRQLGAHIALDDFGTGYSSLNCFKEMPLSTVKIDKSLLDDIETNPTTKVFIKSLVDLTHGFDMSVCAEGVETEGQYEILKNGKVDVIQGYYFGMPCTPEEFEIIFKLTN